jgi:hypothetical protein
MLPHSGFIRVEKEHMEDILKLNPHERQDQIPLSRHKINATEFTNTNQSELSQKNS